MKTQFATILLVLLCGAAAPRVHAQSNNAAAAPSTTAPAEARQFDFLVGQWELEVKPKVNAMIAMFHGTPKLAGSWKAWRALDGFGIEDEVRIVDASGNPM